MKRINALSDVLSLESTTEPVVIAKNTAIPTYTTSDSLIKYTKETNDTTIQQESNNGNIMSPIINKIPAFYSKADSMAESLALLLNKK